MLKIHVLNVGHGDSIVFEFSSGCYGIVDSNTASSSTTDANALIAFFSKRLFNNQLNSIEFVCVSHPHSDHFRGLAGAIKWFYNNNVAVKRFYDFGASKSKALAMLNSDEDDEETLELVKLEIIVKKLEQERGLIYEPISNPRESLLRLGEVTIRIHTPLGRTASEYYNFLRILTPDDRRRFCKVSPGIYDDNIISSMWEVIYGEFRFLSCGDVPNCVWKQLFATSKYEFNKISVVKMSHHGSLNGNEIDEGLVLKRFAPNGHRSVLISGGYRYSLPLPETVADLRKLGWDVYCTGPVCKSKPTSFIPKGLPPEVRDTFVAHRIAFNEPPPVSGSGNGTIEVQAQATGSYTIMTELDVSRA